MRRYLIVAVAVVSLSLMAATTPPAPAPAAGAAATAVDAATAVQRPTAAKAAVIQVTAPDGATLARADLDVNQAEIAGIRGGQVDLHATPAELIAPAQAPNVANLGAALAQEMEQAKAGYKQRLAQLTLAFQQAVDAHQALELERQIERLKLDTELGYIEMQERHARAMGMTDLAEEAQAIIDAMKLGPGAPTPGNGGAPAGGGADNGSPK
jgi:hypothetical protein